MWASHLGILPGGLKLKSWMYPAAGEAKQPETDGAMPRLKKRRYQAINAKAIVDIKMPNAAVAATPLTNVACMKYNGGGVAETICAIDLANPAAKAARPKKKVKTIDGISSIHYIECEERGTRVWHVAGVGEGRLIPWETIKAHHNGKNVVDPCVPLIHVSAAIDPARATPGGNPLPSNELAGKIHRSHVNVKARKKQRKLRSEAKKRLREHRYHKQVEVYERRLQEVKNRTCPWCSKWFISIAALRRHQKNGCTSALGKMKLAVADAEETDVHAEQETSNANTVPVSAPAPVVDAPALDRGYAWIALRAHITEVVGPRATVILEQAFRRGIAKGGDRQSCFQMVSNLS